MKRKLIDHNDKTYGFSKNDTNEQLLHVLKKAKKEK